MGVGKLPIVCVKYLELGEVSIERRYIPSSDTNKRSHFEDVTCSPLENVGYTLSENTNEQRLGLQD